MRHTSIEILLRSIIDYAGTFPPAKLSVAGAVSSYARYRAGAHAWMLGRFVLPAGRLPEFEELAPPVRAGAGTPWPLSLVLSSEAASEIDRIPGFINKWERLAGRVEVVAVEIPPIEPATIGPLVDRLPDAMEAFVEVSIGPNLDATVKAIAASAAIR